MMSSKKTYQAMSVAMSILLYAGFSSADAANITRNTLPTVPPAWSENGQPPAPPDGQLPPGPPPNGQQPPDGQPGGPQQQTKSASELKATKIVDNETTTLTQQQLANGNTDENVVLARNGAQLTLTDSTLTKTGDSSSADASNFSGQNAIFLAADSQATLTSARWGTTGQNGGNFTLNTTEQTLTGDILANNISELHINLGDKTTWTGTINSDNQAKTANLTLAATATWTLTADAYVTTFSDAQADYSNIQSQGHNIYYSKASNPKLNGKTIPLPGGGQLIAK